MENTEQQRDDKFIGAVVRNARSARGLTQQQVADEVGRRAGLSWQHSTVAKVESGARTLAFIEAMALADAFGVDIADLATSIRTRDSAELATRLQYARWSRDFKDHVLGLEALKSRLENLRRDAPDYDLGDELTALFASQRKHLADISRLAGEEEEIQ